MNRSELYYKTITTLNDAWRKGGLSKGKCAACAVGNMLGTNKWASLFCTRKGVQHSMSLNDHVAEAVLLNWTETLARQVYSQGVYAIYESGYTQQELMRVEFAFETAPEVEDNERQSQYNGLCSVFEVLQQIHEVEFSIAQTSKEELDCVYELLN